MRFTILILSLWLAGAANAQTVSPAMVEGQKHVAGIMTLTNNSIDPLAAVIEVYEITYLDGRAAFAPVTSNVHVKLSSTSTRLGPKGSATITYDIRCDHQPCGVALNAGFRKLHQSGGLVIVTKIPATFWMCESARRCSGEIRKQVEAASVAATPAQ